MNLLNRIQVFVITTSVFVLSFVFCHSFAGDNCIIDSGAEPGKCTPIDQCLSAVADLQLHKKPPQTCGFEGSNPLVCCSLLGALVSGTSVRKCKDYEKEVAPLQVYSIVGGTAAAIMEFPHMAALGFGNEDNIAWQCGGSLISDQFILTAAHCLHSADLGDVTWVRLGDLKIYEHNLQDYKVAKRIPHPDYRPPSTYNDIALLQLEKKVKYTYSIKPACVDTESSVNEDNVLMATGWGLLQFGGDRSDVLQKVTLELFTHEECVNTYKNQGGRRLKNGIQKEQQFCAGGRNVQTDTCQGDSGGPLQSYRINETLFRIIGITSFGKSCGTSNIPGVYTRVSNYVPWIESVVWK